jgi:hypothetical protein
MIACERCRAGTGAVIRSQITGERLCLACREDERAALESCGVWSSAYRWRRRGLSPLVAALCKQRRDARQLGVLA